MLWGAFNNSSSAMQAMSWDMGSISQNIANLNTTGYKRKETMFKTVMSESHAAPGANGLQIFGVKTADRTHVADQGVITPTNVWSDLAINGKGFFVLGAPTVDNGAPTTLDFDDPASVVYGRNGALSQKPDTATGRNYLTSQTGHYVMGWMADDTGTVATTGSLQALYTVPGSPMAGRATTNVDLIANIDASQPLSAATTSTTNLTVTDDAIPPADHTMALTWTRTGANSWDVTASLPAAEGTVTGTCAVTMDAWGTMTAPAAGTFDFTIDWTLSGGTAAVAETVNIAATRPTVGYERLPLAVVDDYTPTTGDGLMAPIDRTMTTAWERVGANTWYLHMQADSGGGWTGTTTIQPYTVVFNTDGSIQSVTDSTGADVPPDAIPMDGTWTRGTETATVTSTLNIEGMTQFAQDMQIWSVDQDGMLQGRLRRADFNAQGELWGSFDNGKQMMLGQVALAVFRAENALESVSGTLFRRTEEAGDLDILPGDEVPGGTAFNPGALENSTADIGDEFTKMIMTQKAYSSNATVFKTADEMTSTARDLMG